MLGTRSVHGAKVPVRRVAQPNRPFTLPRDPSSLTAVSLLSRTEPLPRSIGIHEKLRSSRLTISGHHPRAMSYSHAKLPVVFRTFLICPSSFSFSSSGYIHLCTFCSQMACLVVTCCLPNIVFRCHGRRTSWMVMIWRGHWRLFCQ